jgi:hypothetical protein
LEREGDVEFCTEVEIKEEPESDDDDDEYQLRIAEGDTEDEAVSSKAHGQTSIDLASNKKDVSLILTKLLYLYMYKCVKLSHYRPLGFQEVEAPRISRHLACTGGKVVSPTHRPSLRPGDIPGTHFC